jgi:excisionase family DNA binding protein
MKLNLEQEELKLIAKDVADELKPLLKITKKSSDSDIVFDVKGLAEYLKVNDTWVYKKVQIKEIPYFKCGKYPRFKKAKIDKWIEEKSIKPVPLF